MSMNVGPFGKITSHPNPAGNWPSFSVIKVA